MNLKDLILVYTVLAVFIPVLSLHVSAFQQGKETVYNHPYLRQADSLNRYNSPHKALEAYQLALKKFSRDKNRQGEITAACKIAGIHIVLRQYDNAAYYLADAEGNFRFIPKDSIFLGDIFFRKGILFNSKLKLDSALVYHQRALEIRIKFLGKESDAVASSFNEIGNIYGYKYLDYTSAEKNYKNAYNIWETTSGEDNNRKLAIVCYNLATVYRQKGDIEKAVSYAHQAQNYYRINNQRDYLNIALCQNLLANTFFSHEQFKESLPHFHNAIRYMKFLDDYADTYLPTLYTNLSASFLELNQPDSALFYLHQALSISPEWGVDSVQIADAYRQIGLAYLLKKSSRAREYYQRSLQINEKLFGTDHLQTAYSYYDFAKYAKSTQEYDTAITYAIKGLSIMGYENLLVNNTPSFMPKEDVSGILEGLSLLAACQTKRFEKNHEFLDLEQALANYNIVDRLITQFRVHFSRESSRLGLSKRFKYMYEDALNCAYLMYLIRPSEDVANATFNFMEKNKAMALRDFIKSAESNINLGIPDSIHAQVQSLEAQINYFQAELYQPLDEKDEVALQSSLFISEQKLEKLKNMLASKYPEYHKNKYVNRPFQLEDLRSYLKKKKAIMIEYFYGDSSLFVMAVSPNANRIHFQKIDNKSSIDSLANRFSKSLHEELEIENLEEEFQAFVYTSYHLYDNLAATILGDNNFMEDLNRLIIIPDGTLSFVPFEAFTRGQPKTQEMDYRQLDYLIKEFTISYGFSAQVLAENTTKQYPPNTLLFNNGTQDQQGSLSIDLSLAGAIEETEYISSLIGNAILYTGKSATKSPPPLKRVSTITPLRS